MSNGVDRRAQIDIETVKGLLLVNGGGAVVGWYPYSARWLAGINRAAPVCGPLGSLRHDARYHVARSFTITIAGSARYTTNSIRCRRREAAFLGVPLPEPGVCFVGTLFFLWASVICFTSAGGYVAYTGLTNMEQLQRGGKSKAPPQTALEAKKNPDTKAKK